MHRIEAYFRLGIIFIIIISILYLPILFKLKKKGISAIRQISYIGLGASVFLIIFATILFTPITFEPETHVLNVIPFNMQEIGMEQFLIEKIPNIILFIPLGFFLPVVFKSNRKAYKTILVTFALTFGVEIFQYFIGRSSDIDDIMTNLLGGMIGFIVFKLLNSFLKKTTFWNKLIER